jgi:hypothetical protein
MAGKKIGWIFLNTLNNNMLQLSYLIFLYSISIVLLFLYSLAHFIYLLNYLKVKQKTNHLNIILRIPFIFCHDNYLFIMKNML